MSHDTLLFFIDKVKTGGDWDFKNNPDWNLNDSDIYVYKGLVFRKDEISNIRFGYVGAALFELYALKAGAGVYQIISGTSQISYFTSFFNDPVDAKAIEYGYRMRINENNRFEQSPLDFIISYAFFFTFSHEHDHYTITTC